MERLIRWLKGFSRAAVALAGVAVFAGAASANADELLQNGGFESPYLGPSNWTYLGLTSYPGGVPPEDIIILTPRSMVGPTTTQLWSTAKRAVIGLGQFRPTGFGSDQFAALQLASSLSQVFASSGSE